MTLPALQREHYLREIQDAIKNSPDPATRQNVRWADLAIVDDHLGRLIEIARQMETNLPEAFIGEMLDNVCPHCPMQEPSGHCTLRQLNTCLLYRCIVPVIQSLQISLREQDSLAVASKHPSPSQPADNP